MPKPETIEELDTKQMLYDVLLDYFRDDPNSSPSEIIDNPAFPPGMLAAAIVILRDKNLLVVTGKDANGVLLSCAP